MSVNLSPMPARRMSVGAADDPYKKYWWGILAGFIVTGMWLCIPIMETPVGSVHVDTRSKAVDASSSEQSLDSPDNPSGAAGGALDLSMDGAKHKSKSGDADDMTSMLFQAPPDPGAAAAAGKPLGDATAASASASLAQQLKDAGKKDSGGWGGEKAQRGFNSPHLAGGSLSGMGSLGGGGSSASAGGVNGAFGSHNANVGFEATKGLHDDGSTEPAGLHALAAAAKAGPNLKGSAEALSVGAGQSFDGGRGKGAGPSGASQGAYQQASAMYDAAPANLKANDPKIDQKKLPDPPAAPTANSNPDQTKQMIEMVGLALVGGMVGGVAGQMIAMVGSQMIQMQAQQDAAKQAAQQQQQVQQRYGIKPST